MSTSSNGSTAKQNDDFYNDNYSGIGWINSIRVHQSPGHEPFTALDLHVKQGPKEPKDGKRIRTLRLNTIIRGSLAAKVSQKLMESIDFSLPVRTDSSPDGRPVVSARFVAGSLELGSYVKQESEEVIPTLRAALLSLSHVYVDGELFDQASESETDTDLPTDTDEQQESIPVDQSAHAEPRDYAPIADWIETSLDLDVIELDPSDTRLGLKFLYLQESGYQTHDSLTWNVPSQALA